MSKAKTAITPVRAENYPEWYQQVVRAADLAEPSPVRGCMIIKPWGYAIWEKMQAVLDGMFKATGHKNAYFPLFIPKRFLEQEAKHVEGFAKECAVVTHHRLEAGPDGSLVPAGELDEPLVVRPTSETIIGEAFSRWVESYRDLPLLINQWANVVRWEMRTRLFLRTSEFLWQEGHTAHASEDEAREHTRRMLDVYAEFCEEWMAMPVLRGRKSEAERFPGAVDTLCIEAMMQDRKGLQAGTSHFLGQNFARAQDIVYLSEQGEREHAWTTSWGVSTRLIGGLLMTHSDDDGLVLPPRLAPSHVVIMPITFKADDPEAILSYCRKLADDLRSQAWLGRPLDVELDERDIRGGEKTWSWIKKGVPIRLEIGPRDMESDSVFMGRRDKSPKDKESVGRERFLSDVHSILDEMQQGCFDRALAFREEHTRDIDSREEFESFFASPEGEPTPIHGGFARTHFCGDPGIEEQIKNDLGVTIRCMPLDADQDPGTCPFSGQPSTQRVTWGKSY
ncbi:MAG: proline--tRNA ligase [Planctomycetota bacterium]|nr:proline--tRNA ligase [Planctomycetota bacterium]